EYAEGAVSQTAALPGRWTGCPAGCDCGCDADRAVPGSCGVGGGEDTREAATDSGACRGFEDARRRTRQAGAGTCREALRLRLAGAGRGRELYTVLAAGLGHACDAALRRLSRQVGVPRVVVPDSGEGTVQGVLQPFRRTGCGTPTVRSRARHLPAPGQRLQHTWLVQRPAGVGHVARRLAAPRGHGNSRDPA